MRRWIAFCLILTLATGMLLPVVAEEEEEDELLLITVITGVLPSDPPPVLEIEPEEKMEFEAAALDDIVQDEQTVRDELTLREECFVALDHMIEFCDRVTEVSEFTQEKQGVEPEAPREAKKDKDILFRLVENPIRAATRAMVIGGVDISSLEPSEKAWLDARSSIQDAMDYDVLPEEVSESSDFQDAFWFTDEWDRVEFLEAMEFMTLEDRVRYLENSLSIFEDVTSLLVAFLRSQGALTSTFWMFGISMDDLELAAKPDLDTLRTALEEDPGEHNPDIYKLLIRQRYVDSRFQMMNEALKPFEHLMSSF